MEHTEQEINDAVSILNERRFRDCNTWYVFKHSGSDITSIAGNGTFLSIGSPDNAIAIAAGLLAQEQVTELEGLILFYSGESPLEDRIPEEEERRTLALIPAADRTAEQIARLRALVAIIQQRCIPELLRGRIDELEGAIRKHRSQKADDRCIEDDDELYAALGDGIKCDRRVGDKIAMLENCARFIERRCEGGGWPTYQELEADRDKWKALVGQRIIIAGMERPEL